MSASITLDGIKALAQKLDRLPDAYQARAAAIVQSSAQAAKSTLVGALPKGPTGNLKAGVGVRKRGPLAYQVESRAPHAWLNEYGSGPRQTNGGASRGQMPARPVVGRVASDERQRMNAALVDAFTQIVGRV